jgi:hypothetical protein
MSDEHTVPNKPFPSQMKPRATARLDEEVRELAGERTIDAVVNAALQLWVEHQRAPKPDDDAAAAAVEAATEVSNTSPSEPALAPTPPQPPAAHLVVPADQLPWNMYRPPGRSPSPPLFRAQFRLPIFAWRAQTKRGRKALGRGHATERLESTQPGHSVAIRRRAGVGPSPRQNPEQASFGPDI